MMVEQKHHIPESLRSLLARTGSHRGYGFNALGNDRFEYPASSSYRSIPSEEKAKDLMTKYEHDLPLRVPGLQIEKSELTKSRFGFKWDGKLWFTWSHQAARARYLELFEEFGIADPRLAYQKCSGEIRGQRQLNMPGMPVPEPRMKSSGGVWAAWTSKGLMDMDRGFGIRIRHPNEGGTLAIPYDQRIEDGTQWWLVGSRGDSLEVMEIEILASPLDGRTKENLLFNLRNYRK